MDTAGKSGTVISGKQGRDQETTQTARLWHCWFFVSLQLSSLECLRTLDGFCCMQCRLVLGTDLMAGESHPSQMQQGDTQGSD